MENIVLAFVTGLTTGGLSCLAVQGGLLASSIADQVEKDIQGAPETAASKKRKPAARLHLAQPILAFLGAKLLAYTLLGLLLGLVGSMFQLSNLGRAVLQFAIGVFMLGSALRMLNVHPIFRYFVFEPPAFLRRYIRKTARNATIVTPLFLGFLTVLIPCGVTQAMMAVALGTADPLAGAALMFAFTLGTSPVFFAVAYFATQLGARLEKYFLRFVAVVVLILGLVTIDSGLNLAGSPVSFSRAARLLLPQDVASAQANETASFATAPGPQAPANAEADNVITVTVKNNGYQPNVVHARAGTPLRLKLVTQGVYSCSQAFVIPALDVQMNLKSTGVAWVDIPPQAKGTVMPFSCSMGMFTGDIVFDL